MNVIFLDFDGVLDTVHFQSYEDVENKIKILASIAHNNNCKIVIEAAAKDSIDEDTMELSGEWINFIFRMFDKYGIECIGRTPNVIKRYSEYSYTSMWKENEIILYLLRHPEVDHFCIIDDDDRKNDSDLNKVRDYLIKTIDYSESNPELEGILDIHDDEVSKILKKENKYKKNALKLKNRGEV